MKYYMPEVMSLSGRKAFEAWHAKQSSFDFADELVAYCESDVKLLKEGCLTIKRLFEQQANFNPFDHMTIASACNRDLRQNRMTPSPLNLSTAGVLTPINLKSPWNGYIGKATSTTLTFSMQATWASFAFPIPILQWMVTTRPPT